jgi:hypothetical protein
MSVSGCNGHYEFVLGAGAKVEERSDEIPPWRGKKCDKPINFVVRVSGSLFFKGYFKSIKEGFGFNMAH